MTPGFPAASSDEVVSALIKIGFRLKRQAGSSHAIYFREADGKRTTVPIHPGKPLKRKTLKSILTDTGLTIAEFSDLLKG